LAASRLPTMVDVEGAGPRIIPRLHRVRLGVTIKQQ
jgi:hypothetical protein